MEKDKKVYLQNVKTGETWEFFEEVTNDVTNGCALPLVSMTNGKQVGPQYADGITIQKKIIGDAYFNGEEHIKRFIEFINKGEMYFFMQGCIIDFSNVESVSYKKTDKTNVYEIEIVFEYFHKYWTPITWEDRW